MALSLIVFDCDGIILESVDIKTRAFYRIGLDFGQEAADRLVMYHTAHGGVSRYDKFDWLYEEYLGKKITPEEKAALGDKFARYALEEVERCGLVPGIREALDAWHGRVPLYVASGAPHEELVLILEKRGLSRYFAGIFGSPPGKTQVLRSIVEQCGVLPSETVMVGDSSTDMYAAQAVGTLFYGRGRYFAGTDHPWADDLTGLNAWLEGIAAGV